MRGKTASGKTEILNFSMKNGYAFRLIEFQVYPSNDIGGTSAELAATITADKLDTSVDPQIVNTSISASGALTILGSGSFGGHITASGDISASGNITSSGNIVAAGTIMGNYIDSPVTGESPVTFGVVTQSTVPVLPKPTAVPLLVIVPPAAIVI